MYKLLDDWLFKPDDPRPYALLRISVGLTTFLTLLTFWPYLQFYYTDSGFYPIASVGQLQDQVYPVSLLYFSDSIAWVRTVYSLTLIAGLLYAIGVYTRWMGPLLWLLLASMINRNVFVADGSLVLLLQLLIPMMFVDTGATFSWDAKYRPRKVTIPSWLGVIIRFQLSWVYLLSGVYKLMGADWVGGQAVRFVLSHPAWRRFDFEALLSQSWIRSILDATCLITPWWELFFPLLVLNKYTRWLALGFGVFLHGSQWMTINTGLFAPLLLSIYPLYLTRETRSTIWNAIRRRFRKRDPG